MKLKTIIAIISIVGLTACQSISDAVTVKIEHPVLPILTMKETNPAIKMQLVKQHLAHCTVKRIVISLQGSTNINDIRSLSLYQADKDGHFCIQKRLAEAEIKGDKAIFNSPLALSTDTMNYWISIGLNKKIKLTDRLQLTCKKILTTDREVKLPIIKKKRTIAYRCCRTPTHAR